MAKKTSPLPKRFWDKVEKTDYCWNWTAGLDTSGYGLFWLYRHWGAHRLSFIASGGILTKQKPLVLHKCKNNKRCVNPKHLYAGDRFDNQRDAVADGTHYLSTRTHCKSGHRFEAPSIPGLHRSCKPCRKLINKQYRERNSM